MAAINEPTARRPQILTDLPTEMLQHIATFLDLPSATCLARTCQHLQPIVEAQLCATLDLPLSSAGGDHGLTKESRPRSVTTLQAIEALRARPIRTTYVKRVSAMPAWGNSPYTHVLLDMVRDSLKILELHGAPAALLSQTDLEDGHKCLVKHTGLTIFPNLRGLSLPLDSSWWKTAIMLLASAPDLEYLIIRAGWGESDPVSPATTGSIAYPILPQLRNLGIERFSQDSVDLIIHLVQTSPHLAQVSLRTNHGNQTKSCWRGFADALRWHETLWELDVGERVSLDFEKGGFQHLKHLTLNREYKGCSSWLLDVSGPRSNRWLIRHQEIDIPPLVNLEHLTFTPVHKPLIQDAFGTLPPIYPCVLQEPHSGEPIPVRNLLIPDRIVPQLRASPKLRSIIFPSRYCTSNTTEVERLSEFSPLGSMEWIRIWRLRPPGDQIWCRSHSHKVRREDARVEHRAKRINQDWVMTSGMTDTSTADWY